MNIEQFQLNARIELTHWWFTARRAILRALIEEIVPPASAMTVVDVGCGTGGNIAGLADRYRCIGIDPSRTAIAFARQRFPSVEFLCGHAPDDLGHAVHADLFILADVLEHVAEDRDLLQKLIMAADPGTHFLLTVPADPSLWSRHDESHGHYRRYEQEQFERLWDGLPVEARLTSYFNSRLCAGVRFVRRMNRWLGRSSGEANTDLRVPPRPVNRILERSFRGEAGVLLRLLRGESRRSYRRGVSLIAILQRKPNSRRVAEGSVGVSHSAIELRSA